jgi:hypothetical protein
VEGQSELKVVIMINTEIKFPDDQEDYCYTVIDEDDTHFFAVQNEKMKLFEEVKGTADEVF